MTYEVWWRNPATGIEKTLEFVDEQAARDLVEHYTTKYGRFPGFQAPVYREKLENER